MLLRAYRSAAGSAPASCHLPVSLLAAIGQVESGSLVGRELDAEHRTSILGPVLNGRGFAADRRTPTAGSGTGTPRGTAPWARCSSSRHLARPSASTVTATATANPQDVEDAAAATAAYLCYGGRDLSEPADLGAAILSYNHSASYQRLVLTYQQRYARLGLDRGPMVIGSSDAGGCS